MILDSTDLIELIQIVLWMISWVKSILRCSSGKFQFVKDSHKTLYLSILFSFEFW